MDKFKSLLSGFGQNNQQQSSSIQGTIDKYTTKKEPVAPKIEPGLMSIAPTPIPQTIAAPKKVDVVNSQVMQPRPQTTVPTVTPKTTTDNMAMATDTFTAQNESRSQTQPKVKTEPTVKSDKDILRDELDRIRGNVSSQADAVAQYQKDEELVAKKEEALRFKKELQLVDERYEEEVAKIKENRAGMLQSQVDADISRAYDRYQNRRANVAISYDTAAEDYNSALERVNQKSTALKEQYAQEIQAYQLASSAIMNNLTESEKIEVNFQNQLKLERAKSINDTYETIMNNAVLNGAPASVLSAIDDAASNPNASAKNIITAAGSYGQKKSDTKRDTSWQDIDGKRVLVDNQTGEIISSSAGQLNDNKMAKERGADKIEQIEGLLKNTTGIGASAGIKNKTINPFNINTVEDWRADAKTVLSRLTVDELGRIKADGVTFGALSDPEREAVGSAASALNAGAVKENGELTGRFNISESKVKDELEKIKKYAIIDFERRTGQTYEEFKNAATLPAEDLAEINESLGVSNFTPGLYYSNQ